MAAPKGELGARRHEGGCAEREESQKESRTDGWIRKNEGERDSNISVRNTATTTRRPALKGLGVGRGGSGEGERGRGRNEGPVGPSTSGWQGDEADHGARPSRGCAIRAQTGLPTSSFAPDLSPKRCGRPTHTSGPREPSEGSPPCTLFRFNPFRGLGPSKGTLRFTRVVLWEMWEPGVESRP